MVVAIAERQAHDLVPVVQTRRDNAVPRSPLRLGTWTATHWGAWPMISALSWCSRRRSAHELHDLRVIVEQVELGPTQLKTV